MAATPHSNPENEMKNIVIVGAGGHGAEVDEYVRSGAVSAEGTALKVIGFIDDNAESYQRYRFSAPFLGGIQDHAVRSDCCYVLAIGSQVHRRSVLIQLLEKGAEFCAVIHPSAYVSPSSQIGRGILVGPNVTIGPNVAIGDYTLLNARVSVGHDAQIGSCNIVSPNVAFTGFAKVGDDNFFGLNSAVLPRVSIGNGNTIAAGMIVDKNVGDGETVFYRFKERVVAVTK